MKSTAFTLLLTLLACSLCFAQQKKKVQVLHANYLSYDEKLGKDAQRLIGEVKFKHQDVILRCDSAYLFANDNINAFGKIHITEGDSIHIYGDSLFYQANTRMAKLRNHIIMIDQDMRLETDALDYDLEKDVSSYFHGAEITSKKNENQLTSERGFYFAAQKMFFFKDSVHLNNPSYDLYCDTLRYNTASEVAYFLGPTYIYSEENTIYCENGWYDTKNDLAEFKKNAYLLSDQQKLQGDSLFYDRIAGIGKAYKNVTVSDSLNDYLIYGQFAQHSEVNELSFVTDSAVFVQIYEDDSLFLHADTLYALTDSSESEKTILAFNGVQFFKKDLQGKCDSLVYTTLDSTIKMYTDPILWSEENQITAEHIALKTKDGQVNLLYLYRSAFIVSAVDSTGFNQIKGKKMTGFFRDNVMYKIFVEGNGETLYYAQEEKEEQSEVIGINKAECSDMVIYLRENKVNKITFIKQPTAILYPIDKLGEEEKLLENFSWRLSLRPIDKASIFKEREHR